MTLIEPSDGNTRLSWSHYKVVAIDQTGAFSGPRERRLLPAALSDRIYDTVINRDSGFAMLKHPVVQSYGSYTSNNGHPGFYNAD